MYLVPHVDKTKSRVPTDLEKEGPFTWVKNTSSKNKPKLCSPSQDYLSKLRALPRYIHCMDADTAGVLTVLLTNLDKAASFTNLPEIAIILILSYMEVKQIRKNIRSAKESLLI